MAFDLQRPEFMLRWLDKFKFCQSVLLKPLTDHSPHLSQPVLLPGRVMQLKHPGVRHRSFLKGIMADERVTPQTDAEK